MKPKEDEHIADLVKNICIAIEQEKNINNDISKCRGQLTSNVASVIQSIIEDKCNELN